MSEFRFFDVVPFVVPLACGKYFVNTWRAKQLSKFPCIMFGSGPSELHEIFNALTPRTRKRKRTQSSRNRNGQRTTDNVQRTTWQSLQEQSKDVDNSWRAGSVQPSIPNPNPNPIPNPRAQHAQMTELQNAEGKPQRQKAGNAIKYV